MTVIYMQGQSPFHPDPMDVAITDEMGRYIEDVQKFNAKQARELNDAKNAIQIHRGEADCAMWPTSQPRAAEAATSVGDSTDAEGLVLAAKIVGGVLGAIALVSLLAAAGVFA